MSSEKDVVKYVIENKIAWVSYNRPEKRNCMSPKVNRRMMEILDELEYNDEVGVVVLTGEGEAFSAGMDLKEYFIETEKDGLAGTRKAQGEAYGWWKRLRNFYKPTIAMVNGWCFGGAYGPLFACDLAFTTKDAQFGLSEINWGILPGGGATKVVVESMNFRNAMYHAMTGENIDGVKAAEWGLVNEAHDADKLKERVAEVCNILLEKNPVALQATKEAVRKVSEMTYSNAEEYLVKAQEAANYFDNTGRKEGIKQFIYEKTYKPGLGAYNKDIKR
ncbi:MAG: p-hydroxycinnamoyl CoA hydratase/lyase [Arcobacter sp.]|nr:MAG: p-hydroxycinnamoyl CoA hydratase/lyase [Arcobacter sp.]